MPLRHLLLLALSLAHAASVTQAALIAYEGFDGSINSSSTGWAGGWATFSSTGAPPAYSAQGLTFGALQTTGGSVTSGWYEEHRTLASPIDLRSGTYWMAYLLKYDSFLSGQNVRCAVEIRKSSTGNMHTLQTGSSLNPSTDTAPEFYFINTTTWNGLYTNTPLVHGTTYLVVVKIVGGSPNFTAHAWVYSDPMTVPAGEPATSGSHYLGAVSDLSAQDGAWGRVRLAFMNAVSYVDELRIGTAYADVVPMDIPAAPPEAPTGLVAVATSTTAIGLTWIDRASNELGFSIERSSNGPSGPFTAIGTTAANVLTYNDPLNLTAGMTYHYRVRSQNAAGYSAYTNTSAAIPSQGPSGGTAVIYPIGDSITWGAGGQPFIGTGPGYHYRAYLENLLLDADVAYNFVGTLNSGANFRFNGPMQDGQHEGHSGEGVDHFLANIDSYAAQLQATPQYLLVCLGANDFTHMTTSTMQPKYTQLFHKLRTLFPQAHILVQGVGERQDVPLTTTRSQMNTMLASIVSGLNDSKIHYIENLTTLHNVTDPNPDWQNNNVADGVHPDKYGHQVIARQFWAKLSTLITGVAPTGNITKAGPNRILCVGDSITWGGATTDGYRSVLQTRLQDEGYAFSYVGTRNNGSGRLHEGYSGNRTDHLKALLVGGTYYTTNNNDPTGLPKGSVPGSYPGHYDHIVANVGRPNIVLMMLGTNDCIQINAGSTTQVDEKFATYYQPLIQGLLDQTPEVHIFVAKITPFVNGGSLEGHGYENRSYWNSKVEQMVNTFASAGHKVYAVSMDNVTDLWNDGVHPKDTANGYTAMANNWLAAIQSRTQTGSSYTQWASTQGLSGIAASMDADPDGDGLANLLEYALGSNPNAPDSPGLTLVRSGSHLVFTYQKDATKTDIAYEVQTSEDLLSWTPLGISETVIHSSGSLLTIEATAPFSQKKFFRLRISST